MSARYRVVCAGGPTGDEVVYEQRWEAEHWVSDLDANGCGPHRVEELIDGVWVPVSR